MKLTRDDLLQVLATIDRLGYGRVRLQHDGLILEVDRNVGAGRSAEVSSVAAAASAPAPAAPDAPGAAVAPSAPPPASPPVDRSDLVGVSAPMTGTFYVAPAPGEPSFVEVGSRVGPDDVVCIIEVMKLFNSIRAGVAGTVEEICVANEATVKPGEPLLWIRPG